MQWRADCYRQLMQKCGRGMEGKKYCRSIRVDAASRDVTGTGSAHWSPLSKWPIAFIYANGGQLICIFTRRRLNSPQPWRSACRSFSQLD